MKKTLPLLCMLTTLLNCSMAVLAQHSNLLGAANQRIEKKAIRPQAEVAAKGEFKTIPAGNGTVTKAIDAKEVEKARKLIDREGAFKGTVTKVYTPKSNSIVILDFAPKFNEALTAVLRPADYAKFPKMETLEGKRVLVTGKFVLYKEKPEIVLTRPEQVKIVK